MLGHCQLAQRSAVDNPGFNFDRESEACVWFVEKGSE